MSMLTTIIDTVGGWLQKAEWLVTAQDVFSYAHLLFVLANVVVVLIAIYMKPIRTWRQFFKILLYLFAAGVICYMTVWLYFNLLKGDA